MQAFVLLALVALAAAGSVTLNNKNFKDLALNSGKNAFVKFQAPW